MCYSLFSHNQQAAARFFISCNPKTKRLKDTHSESDTHNVHEPLAFLPCQEIVLDFDIFVLFLSPPARDMIHSYFVSLSNFLISPPHIFTSSRVFYGLINVEMLCKTGRKGKLTRKMNQHRNVLCDGIRGRR